MHGRLGLHVFGFGPKPGCSRQAGGRTASRSHCSCGFGRQSLHGSMLALASPAGAANRDALAAAPQEEVVALLLHALPPPVPHHLAAHGTQHPTQERSCCTRHGHRVAARAACLLARHRLHRLYTHTPGAAAVGRQRSPRCQSSERSGARARSSTPQTHTCAQGSGQGEVGQSMHSRRKPKQHAALVADAGTCAHMG